MTVALSASTAWQTRARAVAMIAGGVALGIVYFLFPRLGQSWDYAGRALFWLIVLGLVGGGTHLLATSLAPKRWRWRRPGLTHHRAMIPREGIIYLLIMIVLFIGALLGHSNMLMLVFAMMAGPFIVNGWSTFTMITSCRVTRVAPRRAMAGELFSVELVLENRRPLLSAWTMTVRDQLEGATHLITPSVLFARVAPKSSESGHYHLRLMQRGAYEFLSLEVASRFPLGLVERATNVTAPATLLIYPRIGRLTSAWKKRLLGASELVSSPQSRIGMHDDEFHRLREYRTGDNPRAIHWRSSARRSELIVREYDQNREHHLTVFLDLYAPALPNAHSLAAVEWALSVAATLCSDQRRSCSDGRLLVILVGSRIERWEGQASGAGFESLMDLMAVVQPQFSDAAVVNLYLADTVQHEKPGTRFVQITTRQEQPAIPRTAWMQRVQTLTIDPQSAAELVTFDDETRGGIHRMGSGRFPPPLAAQGTPA